MKESEKEKGWISRSFRISPEFKKIFNVLEIKRLEKNREDYNAFVLEIFQIALDVFVDSPKIYHLVNQKRMVKGIAFNEEIDKKIIDLYDTISECNKISKGELIESILLCYTEKKYPKLHKDVLSKVKYNISKLEL